MQIQRDRQSPLMKALYGRLTQGNPQVRESGSIVANIWDEKTGAFADLPVPVFTAVPKDLTPPFLCFRDLDGKPWGSKTRPGEEMTVNFLITSLYPGFKELSNIAQALLVQLTRGALDLSPDGLRLVKLKPGQQVTAPIEGRVNTRIVPFQIIVEDLPEQDPQQGG